MASVRSHILNAVIRVVSKRRLANLELTQSAIDEIRARLDGLGDRIRPKPGLTLEQRPLGNVVTEWTRSDAPARGVIFYCHGGAYMMGSPKVYRGLAARLALQTQCEVAAIDYRLAPEHKYPAAPNDAIVAYEALLARTDPASIVIAGDSAGGNLALVTLLRARSRGLPLPAAAVLLSPWTDLTGSGASMQGNRKRDPMLPAHRVGDAAGLYGGTANLLDPDVSPLFGDFSGLPPTAIHVGSTEILLDDSQRLAERAAEHGVDVKLTIWDRMPHVFPMFSDILPEGRRAIDDIATFITNRIARP
jgi:monoterpene epsilon-lactone hydrolase